MPQSAQWNEAATSAKGSWRMVHTKSTTLASGLETELIQEGVHPGEFRAIHGWI
ncbi:hypothetical protein LBMAG49_26130 [Planctomycetota bacterium]|nr:hypothetical protein LBMAG49_26130 [Planctomycetota bacterium]